MKRLAPIALVFLGSCCTLLGGYNEPPHPEPTGYPNGHPLLEPDEQSLEALAQEHEIGRRIDEYRESKGLPRLTRSSFLGALARAMSRHMIEHDFKAHVNPEGDGPDDRLVRAGGKACRFGENIAWEWLDADGPVTFWINSPPHRENIENPRWTVTGIGVWRKTEGALTWHSTQVFAR